MPKKPDCPRCNNHLVVPDARTVTAFLAQARKVWHDAHPIKNKGGRPLVVGSDLERAADALVRAELEARHSTQLFSKKTATRLIQTLADQFINHDESTIRRRVTHCLINEKSLPLTEQDMAFKRVRCKSDVLVIERAPTVFEALMQSLPAVFRAVQREFPDQWKAAEKTGSPLTVAEIKQLHAAKENK